MNGTAQDAAYHITGFGVAGQLGVGDGECDCAHVVGDYTHGYVDFCVFAIFHSCELADFVNQRGEYVGVVVAFFPLEGHA